MTKTALVLCGGGLDSYVAAWSNQYQHHESTELLFFDYGQKAMEQEWEATKAIANAMNRKDILRKPQDRYGITLVRYIPFDFYVSHIPSALTDASREIETNPQPGVAHEWVPVRNTVFVALALAFAEAHKHTRIVTGINLTAAQAYPDNSLGWLESWRMLSLYATPAKVVIDAPLVNMSKAQIVRHGEKLGVPWGVETWSCYAGGARQCGLCSSCRARKEAFKEARVLDPTEYTA